MPAIAPKVAGAVALALAWAVSGPALGQGGRESNSGTPAVTVFELISCGGGQGTGFLVRDWPGLSGPHIVTALHVVYACKEIVATEASCGGPRQPFLLPVNASATVWKELDLIALPSPETSGHERWQYASLRRRTEELPLHKELWVLGVNTYNSCPSGLAFYASTQEAGQLAKRIVDSGDAERPEAVKGSLSDRAHVILSWSNSDHGFSGAPLIQKGNSRVIGMHQGGSKNGKSSWAVALSRDELQRFKPLRVEIGDLVPGFERPDFGHVGLDAFSGPRPDLISAGLDPMSSALFVVAGAAAAGAGIFFGLTRAAANDLNADQEKFRDVQTAYLNHEATRDQAQLARSAAVRSASVAQTWELLTWAGASIALSSVIAGLAIEMLDSSASPDVAAHRGLLELRF